MASNEIPREMAEMTRAALSNDWETARRIHRKYLPLMQANFIESNPLPVKAVLAMMGKIEEKSTACPCCRCVGIRDRELQKIAADVGLISKPRHAVVHEAVDYLRLRKLAGGTAQDRPAPLQLAASAITARGVRRGMMPTMRAGMGRYQTLSEAREASQHIPDVLIRSECKCV